MLQFTKNLYFCTSKKVGGRTPRDIKNGNKKTYKIMKEQLEEKNTEMGNVITRSEEFIRKNQKMIITIACAVVVVAFAIFGYYKWYKAPREMRAAEEMFAAEQYFLQGDFQRALDCDDANRGFISVIDNYGGTKAGNLAKYYAGIANLRLGNYDEAEKWLGKYSGKDTFTKPIAIMAQGDAEMEKGNTEAAVKQYLSAAKADDNAITAPAALFKAGMGYLMLGDNEKALDCFKQIKRNYPESTEWSDIDKYIGLVEDVK